MSSKSYIYITNWKQENWRFNLVQNGRWLNLSARIRDLNCLDASYILVENGSCIWSQKFGKTGMIQADPRITFKARNR